MRPARRATTACSSSAYPPPALIRAINSPRSIRTYRSSARTRRAGANTVRARDPFVTAAPRWIAPSPDAAAR